MDIPANHPPAKPRRIGVLLVNLGTPDAPTPSAVRRYLKQFLSDRRVVEIPALIWQPILRGIILNVRPRKSAANYAKIWMPQGSPLAVYTRAQSEGLQARLGDAIDVRYAMRYGEPAIARQLEAMKADGCDRILLAPLYPQYSGATTATVVDEAFRALAAMRWQPALRTLPAYHDDPAYISALAASLNAELAALDFEPHAIVASFHGMPERTLHLGDPYHCQCQKTARLLSDALGKPLTIAFQSRFGRAKWLEPSTEDTIRQLASQGETKIAIFAPGFSADCLETLEELAMQGREQFEEAGGERYAYLPCLNDSEAGMAMLETLVRRELSGWL
ncbi:MAG: ferrochelatase [Sphingomonadales bacterium]|jgi:ferrochelatase|nr:ferrochelatase [Sphingomonadales bacterium]MBK9002706.1 ferrochelatase [Sphingomonadales bacterium]MBK9267928.1 ferrochelatase [Sphingomonadales bacterium]MBP6435560.1 ferrochelatase [Sphingorhabdus sp.]